MSLSTKANRSPGFALVLVLMMVALMAIMLVAIMTSVRTESKASMAGLSGQTARQLADLAVQTAQSQIQKATTQGAEVAWASQPGMIRSYDSTGKEAKWFKLYSASKMTEEPDGNQLALLESDLPESRWQEPDAPEYGVFTDLNSPTASDNQTLIYPIVNPAGAKSLAAASDIVAGFDLVKARVPGYQSGQNASASNNPAAMPVRWLYVLEDGSLVPGMPGTKAGEVKVIGASKNNPILGRIAFWTDDETCKLNINTASDGTYFDMPRFNSQAPKDSATQAGASGDQQRIADRQFAVTPPVAREYQRFIGHPAQTRLSVVLPDLAQLDARQRSEQLSNISPMIQWGGSQGGAKTARELTDEASANPLTNPFVLKDPQRPTPYASLDEWIFGIRMNNGQRVLNELSAGADLVSNQQLERLHFFLTSSSEAPEVNLFGKPRITIWPIHHDFLSNPTSDRTTALDRMLANISTLNAGSGNPATYFFTRKDSTSTSADYADISRNKELFGYLRRLSGTKIPGYGSSFNAKYSQAGMDQILTEIFDYIRSTNASDPMLMDPSPAQDRTYASFRQQDMVAKFTSEIMKQDFGRGQVAPIIISDYSTKGFGRFYTVSEVAINIGWNGAVEGNANRVKILPALYFSLFSPSLGPPKLEPNLRIEVKTEDMKKLKITSKKTGAQFDLFGEPNEGSGRAAYAAYSTVPLAVRWNAGKAYPFFWGGAVGPRQLYAGKKYEDPFPYAFQGRMLEIDKDDQIQFSGGTLHIQIFSLGQGDPYTEGLPGNSANLVQELEVTLPPSPNLNAPYKNPSSDVTFETRLQQGFFQEAFDRSPATFNGDVTRSVIAKYNGDLRLVAAQRVVPSAAFAKHPSYDTASPSVHSIRENFPAIFFKSLHGFLDPAIFPAKARLAKNANYSPYFQPITGLVEDESKPDETGDWDNGPGVLPDGPYINKADEPTLQYYYYKDWDPTIYAYYDHGGEGTLSTAKSYSSPNRSIASPVTFGSLPTGVPIGASAAVPWRTLLFRPQSNHFGQTTEPKDSLILDWFWMPVVEPYAISTHFATSGKVNLNYQIAPFTYITRATALIGTLGSEYVISVPTADGATYKVRSTPAATNYRFPVRVVENDKITAAETNGTLRQFKEKFNQGQIFRSATEICGIYLVPEGQSWTSDTQAETYWSTHKLAGDNSRERPYNGLYSRLTTKSNTYTVYVRAQALKGSQNSPDLWLERPEYIVAEYRGSAVINRYLDAEDPKIPDFAKASSFNETLDRYYRYRTLNVRRFLP